MHLKKKIKNANVEHIVCGKLEGCLSDLDMNTDIMGINIFKDLFCTCPSAPVPPV